MQPSNSNSNYVYPIINLPIAQIQTNPIKTQATQVSSEFTFAPLVAAILQAENFTNQQNNPDAVQLPKPTTTMSSVNLDFTNKPNVASILKPIHKCGITKYTNSRIVGGTITQIGQYPWLATLGYRSNTSTNGLQFYCAGSLITRSHVISSAHCLNSYLKVVRLGEHDLSARSGRSNRMDFSIESMKIHENYMPDIILNDIGLIKLRAQAPINGKKRYRYWEFHEINIFHFINLQILSLQFAYRSMNLCVRLI